MIAISLSLSSFQSLVTRKRDAYKDGYETLCDIGEGRIRRAGDKIKTELEESNRQLKLGEGPKQLPDIGFRVFELDESGIEKPEPVSSSSTWSSPIAPIWISSSR